MLRFRQLNSANESATEISPFISLLSHAQRKRSTKNIFICAIITFVIYDNLYLTLAYLSTRLKIKFIYLKIAITFVNDRNIQSFKIKLSHT